MKDEYKELDSPPANKKKDDTKKYIMSIYLLLEPKQNHKIRLREIYLSMNKIIH